MEIFHGANQVPRHLQGGVATMGNFDGVHCGHAAILSRVVSHSRTLQVPALVYTFDPHPATVLAPGLAFHMLQTLPQRLASLAACGLTAAVVEPFTADFAAMTARDFFDCILVRALAPCHLIVGYDLTFGRHRAGRVSELQQWCQALLIGCDVVEPLFVKEALVSSTYIRTCVTTGRLDDAAAALGRPYALSGSVVRGHGIGTQLGFPTLNMAPDNALIPPEGVYVTSVRLAADDATLHPASTYIGQRPTFGGTTRVVETFLLTTDPGQPATLEVLFHYRVRGDIRFDTPDALKTQIANDVQQAREFHRC